MDTQMNKPLTIKEYADCHGLSETTVRRRIRAGGLDARLEHGRYFIYGQNGDHSGEKANTQNGKEDMQFGQANDHVDSHKLHADSPERSEQQVLIDCKTYWLIAGVVLVWALVCHRPVMYLLWTHFAGQPCFRLFRTRRQRPVAVHSSCRHV